MIKKEYTVKMLHNGRLVEYQPKMLVDNVLTDIEVESFEESIINVEIGAYTTWFDDPSTSVMLHYMTVDDTPVECLYRKLGTNEWQTIDLYADKPFPNTDRRVRWFKLEGLTPDTEYETRLRNHEQIHRFKTMPSTQRDVKIVMISDQVNNESAFNAEAPDGFQTMYDNNVDAIIIAGDLVHDDGRRTSAWQTFWNGYFNAERANNLMLPMIACLGNHDGSIRDEQGNITSLLWYNNGARREHVVFAFNFFSNIEHESYGVIDVSNYLSFVYLDSNHTVPVTAQTAWLDTTLASRSDRHVFPYWHVSPYPTYYSWAETQATRNNWTPLMTQHNIKLVGSGHEHVHLVTKKVTAGDLDDNGVVYTGQGHGMGNNTRGIRIDENEWYVDFISIEEKGFDLIEFRTNGEIHLNKVNLQGDTMYSITL